MATGASSWPRDGSKMASGRRTYAHVDPVGTSTPGTCCCPFKTAQRCLHITPRRPQDAPKRAPDGSLTLLLALGTRHTAVATRAGVAKRSVSTQVIPSSGMGSWIWNCVVGSDSNNDIGSDSNLPGSDSTPWIRLAVFQKKMEVAQPCVPNLNAELTSAHAACLSRSS